MSDVYAVVEGPTEQAFIRDVLAPWLGYQNVILTPIVVGKPGQKGGNVYARAKRDITRFLKQRSDLFVTCMFDFYGMNSKWPGRDNANSQPHENKPIAVESAIKADVVSELPGSFNQTRLIPYVQMHEFEALLFSYPISLAIALGDKSKLDHFSSIREEFDTPEHINDNPETAPSKRIAKVFRNFQRGYKKPLHGSIAAKEITIETMREACPHFRYWVDCLVALGK